MNILLTGATGFVGQQLVDFLLQKTDVKLKLAVRNKAHFICSDRLSLSMIQNISTDTDWHDSLIGCQVVIHTAARVHVMHDNTIDALAEFRAINVNGTLNLARQAEKACVKRFIFISSVGVYGEETNGSPLTELSPTDPQTDYARSKLEAEYGLLTLSMNSRMDVIIIRPPLIYGEKAPGNFGKLLQLIHKGIPLPLATVKNKRSYIFNENLSDFIMKCIYHPKAGNEIFLISDGTDISTTQLIQLLSQGMKKNFSTFSFPLFLLKLVSHLIGRRQVYQKLCGSFQVDSSKAKDLIGWKPHVNIEDALYKTARNYKARAM